MAALPIATAVTTPVVLTVATPVDPELHTPPVTVSAKVVVEPGQSADKPLMAPADGNGFTVIVAIALLTPQLPVIA